MVEEAEVEVLLVVGGATAAEDSGWKAGEVDEEVKNVEVGRCELFRDGFREAKGIDRFRF